MSRSATEDQGSALSRTAFIVAWAAASLMPWFATTLLWCVGHEIAIADGAAAILFGANAGEAEANRAYRILHGVAAYLGSLLILLIEAWLLRQFRDKTRWWWIVGIATALITALLAVLLLVATDRSPPAGARTGIQMLGHLLWAATTWWLMRRWGWRGRYWLGFNIVVALAQPLIGYLGDVVRQWAGVFYTQAGVTDDGVRYVLGELSIGLLGAVLISAPAAWLLWQYVVVHRRPVDAPARGA